MVWLTTLPPLLVFLALSAGLLRWKRQQPPPQSAEEDRLRDALAELAPLPAAAGLAVLGLVVGAATILVIRGGGWSILLGAALMFGLSAPLLAIHARDQGRRLL